MKGEKMENMSEKEMLSKTERIGFAMQYCA